MQIGLKQCKLTDAASDHPAACHCLLRLWGPVAHHHLAHVPRLAHLAQRSRHSAHAVSDQRQRAQLQQGGIDKEVLSLTKCSGPWLQCTTPARVQSTS